MATEPATYRKDLVHPAGHGYGRNVGTNDDPIWIGERAGPVETAIIHATHGKPGTNSIDEALYLRNSADVGSHYLIGRGVHDGRLFVILPENLIAWHSGDTEPDRFQNATSIGIEIHAAVGEAITPAQFRTLAWLLVGLAMRHLLTPADIRSHRIVAYPPGRKSDPAMWQDVELNAWVAGVLIAPRPAELPALPELPAPSPAAPYDEHSPILGHPRATLEQAVAWFRGKDTGEYTSWDVRVILGGYWQTCSDTGVDPVLAIAQMIHETGHLTSFWSQRPRRNPAGIGVTGTPGAGVSFASWAPEPAHPERVSSIEAHIGRLLAYAVLPSYQTPAQADLVQRALSVRSLPTRYWATAPTLHGLEGKWAPGDNYANKIAEIANAIRGTR